jgi:sec-independent protein translocase protein TatA
MGPFGIGEIIFLFFVALIVFGPRKLPEIGKTLGKGMREFKKATEDLKSNWEEHVRESENDTSIKELKQTLQDAHADVTSSASDLTHQVTDPVNEVKSELESTAAQLEEKPATSTINKESDAHPS